MRIECGILLAGGRGTRLGAGVPKALAGLNGFTLLERASETLGSCCADVIVVAPENIEITRLESWRRSGTGARPLARRVFDLAGFEGPLSGLVAGLEACRTNVTAILGVDFPLVTPALLLALRARLERNADCVVMRPGGTAQPLVSVMRATAAPRLREALEAGERSLIGGLGKLNVQWIDDAALAELPGDADSLLNVNTPEDLAAARKALAARGEVSR